MSLTDQELTGLLLDLESDRVERKESAGDGAGIRKAICALANDLPYHQAPGVIFVGVADDGSCANLAISDELLRNLAQMRGDGNILPPPRMAVQKKTLNGCTVATVIVESAANPPVRYRGRVWVRVGPSVQQATAEEERVLAERQRGHDLSFDSRPVEESTSDQLDLDFFRAQYLPSSVAPEVLEQNQRSIDQQLASLRLFVNDRPTFGAIILFGNNPQIYVPGSYVQFLRIDGTELTDPIRDSKELAGPLHEILRQLEELLKLNIDVAKDPTSSAREAIQPDYPVTALRQLTRNALMHRNYEGTNAPTRAYWFTDRIEISNPGGLFGQVNISNFGKGATDYRNPLLAEAMRNLGYVQRFGMGIPLAVQDLRKNGNPEPEFRFEPSSFLVIVRPAK